MKQFLVVCALLVVFTGSAFAATPVADTGTLEQKLEMLMSKNLIYVSHNREHLEMCDQADVVGDIGDFALKLGRKIHSDVFDDETRWIVRTALGLEGAKRPLECAGSSDAEQAKLLHDYLMQYIFATEGDQPTQAALSTKMREILERWGVASEKITSIASAE